jgi:hypothetical protein
MSCLSRCKCECQPLRHERESAAAWVVQVLAGSAAEGGGSGAAAAQALLDSLQAQSTIYSNSWCKARPSRLLGSLRRSCYPPTC